jgi:hypothetical protein
MRHIMTAGVLACALALTAGCGGEADTDDTATATETTTSTPSAMPSETPTTEATPSEEPPAEESEHHHEGTVVEMTLKDGLVTPNGDRVEATAGEPITFRIDADTFGELHVHSTPEQTISFEAGASAHEIVIDRPGVVEVELHDPALIVVQLEVR